MVLGLGRVGWREPMCGDSIVALRGGDRRDGAKGAALLLEKNEGTGWVL